MNKIFILPGQMTVVTQPTQIVTVLGSCVAVLLYDEFSKVVGVNHYLLPECAIGDAKSGRYGDYAIETLISEMELRGAVATRLKAKIFGGSELLMGVSSFHKVGERNIELARKILGQRRIPIHDQHVGGDGGRIIYVDSTNYIVDVKMQEKASVAEGASGLATSGFTAPRVQKDVSVLIVDDSAAVRSLFTKIFKMQGLKVVGAAANAFEAREQIVKLKPTVVTLDIEMPGMSGVKFLEKLMQHMPMPVVMVSSLSATGEAAVRALELGAVEFIEKPTQTDPAHLKKLAEVVAEKVRAAASVDFSRRKPVARSIAPTAKVSVTKALARTIDIVAICGNTGSHESLGKLLASLSLDTPPVVVVNPSLASLLSSYVSSLKGKIKLNAVVADEGRALASGNVYFAPNGKHTTIEKKGLGQYILHVKDGAPVSHQMPSATVLLSSLAQSAPASTMAVMLGGFGSDGVEGSEMLQRKGGVILVQDPSECLFPHVPQKVIELGVAAETSEIEKMAEEIWRWRSRAAA